MIKNNQFGVTLQTRQQIGICVMYDSCGLVERIGKDWDWIWLDAQHGQLGYDKIVNMVRVCNLIDRPVVVRTESHDPGIIAKYLDLSIDGIMIPMVDNAQQAKEIVKSVKFSPSGRRSYGGRRVIDRRGRGYAKDFSPLLICQIETIAGVTNVDLIAKVEGVDGIFFGADDLAVEKGFDMTQSRPADIFDHELEVFASAAKHNGKISGGVFVNSEDVSKAKSIGINLIASCSEASLISLASNKLRNELENISLNQHIG